MRDLHGTRGIFRVGLWAVFGVLAVNLFVLQGVRHGFYREQALENRQVRVRLKAPRGLIRDRDGQILADNMFIADITVPPAAIAQGRADSTLARLISWWGLPAGETLERLQQQRERGRSRLILVPNAEMARIHAVEGYAPLLPGVEVETRARRRYLQGSAFAHVIGYVGEVRQEEVGSGGEERKLYRMGDLIGKAGIEAACEDSLRGREGMRLEEVDASGRLVGRALQPWQTVPPEPGRDVVLTLAAALQESLAVAFAGRPGCAVALALPSGEVLAAYSSPSYDPNQLAISISPQEWSRLTGDPDKPLFNRIVQATYPPGSIYKIVTSLCALESSAAGHHTRLEPCGGGYRLGNRVFRCWKREGHGSLEHTEALAHSCDVFYYQVGLRLDLDRLRAAALSFGLGRRLSDVFPEEAAGNIPSTVWYDERYGPGRWSRGVMLNNAIGQGEILVTPLQIAALAGGVATGGALGQPVFVRGSPQAGRRFQDLPFSPEDLRWVREAMQRVVDAGTGAAVRSAGVPVAGKTGTAQNPHGDDHAWFMCYAPADDPAVALSVVLDNAGHGGSQAAPLAGRWLRAYFEWAQGRERI